MNKYFLAGIFLTFSIYCFSQNFVPNPGFEQTITCNYPLININPGEYPFSIDTSELNTISVTNWFTHFSADYFNKCNPRFPYNYYQFLPRTGNGYAGIISITRFDSTTFPNHTGTREFIVTKLQEPLHAGCTYRVSFYVRLNPTPHVGVMGVMGIDGMGMYLSENKIDKNNWHQYEPQIKNPDGSILNDTSGYVEISGFYIAQGGEKYITIGNFKTDINTNIQVIIPHNEWGISGAYYLIDDVSIIPIVKPSYQLNLGKDTMLCSDNLFPVTISAQSNFDNYIWSTGNTNQSAQITSPGTYWVKADWGCGFLTDTITIHSKELIEKQTELGKDTVFCNEIPFNYHLEVSKGPYTIDWSTNETQNSIPINSEGLYWVELKTSCGIISDTISIRTESSVRPVSLGNDSLICDTTNLNLELKIENTFERYLWSTGETSSNIRVTKAGNYWVTAYFQCGHSSDSITLSTMEKPAPLFHGTDTTFCKGLTVDFTIPNFPAKYNYHWEISKAKSIELSETGVYKLFITNECYSISDSIQVRFVNCEPFIPNLITVNNDDSNDLFEIISSINSILQVTIYNAWGQRIYYSNNYQNDWPFDAISSGIYYYSVRDEFLSKDYNGWIHVISNK